MSPRQAPHEPIREQDRTHGRDLRASHRIAIGALARSVGEIVAKVASLVFYVVLARELGQELFGDFIFGMALGTVLMIGAGLGLQDLVAREVARDRNRVDDLFYNVAGIKAVMLLALLPVIAIIVALKGYSFESGAAIIVICVGVGLDQQATTVFAVLQALERNHHVATSLIVNRVATAALVVVVLAAGGGILAAAVVFTLGSLLGVASAYLLMRRYVVRPHRQVDSGRWPELIRAGFPLGVVGMLHQGLLRLSVVLLGFLAASATVGDYGAAFRLIEAMMFVPWAFGGAIQPWFARHTGEGLVSLGRGYEMVTKAMLTVLTPVALVFAIFAEPLIEFLYGPAYDGAVVPLQLLAVMTIVFGLNSTATTIFIGRDRPQDFTRPAAIALATSILLGLLLMSRYGADGAALTVVLCSVLLFGLSFRNMSRLVGSISPVRVLVAPVVSGMALTLTALVLSGIPWVVAAIVATAAYGLVFLVLERLLFPGDFAFYAGMLRVRRAAASSS